MSQIPTTSNGSRSLEEIRNRDQRYFRPAYRYQDKEDDSSVNESVVCQTQDDISISDSLDRETILNVSDTVLNPSQLLITDSNVCPHCKKTFKNERGVKVHIGISHRLIANRLIVNKLTKKTKTTDLPSSQNIETEQRRKNTNDVIDKEDLVQRNIKQELDVQCSEWTKKFEDIQRNNVFNAVDFNLQAQLFVKFLYEANEKLPGPRHPAVKFYRMRKKRI